MVTATSRWLGARSRSSKNPRMLGAGSISLVLDVLEPERSALVELLIGLGPEDWARPTECPAYSVKGVATHLLGDDLSLLSRQRDQAIDGTTLLAADLPGADFPTLLDTFNDRWVSAAAFLSGELLIELLRLTGQWTGAYYRAVDPAAPSEPVEFFGAHGSNSPFWQAIGREYLERWVHHSQIRRALNLGSLAERQFLVPGMEVAGAAGHVDPQIPREDDDDWALGPVVLGPAGQAADILTRAHPPDEARALATGPPRRWPCSPRSQDAPEDTGSAQPPIRDSFP
jgi:uncharacterized protein (TIGR03083 family)